MPAMGRRDQPTARWTPLRSLSLAAAFPADAGRATEPATPTRLPLQRFEEAIYSRSAGNATASSQTVLSRPAVEAGAATSALNSVLGDSARRRRTHVFAEAVLSSASVLGSGPSSSRSTLHASGDVSNPPLSQRSPAVFESGVAAQDAGSIAETMPSSRSRPMRQEGRVQLDTQRYNADVVNVPELGPVPRQHLESLAAFLNGAPNSAIVGSLPDLRRLDSHQLQRVVAFLDGRLRDRGEDPERALEGPAQSREQWHIDEAAFRSLVARTHHAPDGQECAICCQTVCYSKIGTVSLPCRAHGCGSFFHISCIRPWLERNPNCPLCRRGLDDLVRSSPSDRRDPAAFWSGARAEDTPTAPGSSSSLSSSSRTQFTTTFRLIGDGRQTGNAATASSSLGQLSLAPSGAPQHEPERRRHFAVVLADSTPASTQLHPPFGCSGVQLRSTRQASSVAVLGGFADMDDISL